MFWRDTTQWAQSLVLFGLLGVYILNLRHFSQQLTNPFWLHLVWYLNLGACSLNLATLTTRFVYPQFSLEGKRLWIVGMAPLGLARVVGRDLNCAMLTEDVADLAHPAAAEIRRIHIRHDLLTPQVAQQLRGRDKLVGVWTPVSQAAAARWSR